MINMIEVVEPERNCQDEGADGRVSPLPSTLIDEEDFENHTKDRDFSEQFLEIDETSQCSAMMYTVDSSCSPEDEPLNIDTAYCSNEDEPDMVSPTSSSKMKPNYHRHPKPPFSYIALIAMAIKDSPSGKLTLAEINEYLMKRFPFFRGSYTGWRNSVRHNLSLNECFIKILRDPSRPWGKDNYWTINENSEYTFADGVFRRRRKRINRSSKNNSSKSHLHGTERNGAHHQQSKGKFTGPFSIDSILGNTENKDDGVYELDSREQADTSNRSSPSELYPYDQSIPLVKASPIFSQLQQHPTKSPTRSAIHDDLKTFRTHIPSSSSVANTIGHLQRYNGLAGRYFELETLQYQSRVKTDVGSAFVPLVPSPLEAISGEHRVRLPWGRPMMPSRIPVCFAPVVKRGAHAPTGFLVENLISR